MSSISEEVKAVKIMRFFCLFFSHPLGFGIALLAVTFYLTTNKQKTYLITAETSSSGKHLLSTYITFILKLGFC
jgi:hypothetical protein